MRFRSSTHARRPRPPVRRPGASALVALLGALLVAAPASGGAQRARTLTACTPDALAFCAELRLTASAGMFEVALRTVGATAQPALPVSFYNLVLGTGAPAAAGSRTTALAPGAVGGATVGDASPWELFDSGDALFLSALTNRGVGGCVAGGDVEGFGQAAATCGPGQFAVFAFSPTAAFDVGQFTILDLEAVVLTAGLPAASCGAPGSECRITADVTTPPDATTAPEPAAVALVGAGLVLTGVTARARRRGTC